MTLDQEISTVKKIPFFKTLPDARLKLIAFTSEKITFEEGETIFEQGEQGHDAYIILDGEADVFISNKNIQEKVATIGKNQIIGEISVICDVPRTATIIAKSKLQTLQISRDFFHEMIREFPEVSFEITKELALRLAKTMAQYHDLLITQTKTE